MIVGGLTFVAAETGEESIEEIVSAISATRHTPRQSDVPLLLTECAETSNETMNLAPVLEDQTSYGCWARAKATCM